MCPSFTLVLQEDYIIAIQSFCCAVYRFQTWTLIYSTSRLYQQRTDERGTWQRCNFSGIWQDLNLHSLHQQTEVLTLTASPDRGTHTHCISRPRYSHSLHHQTEVLTLTASHVLSTHTHCITRPRYSHSLHHMTEVLTLTASHYRGTQAHRIMTEVFTLTASPDRGTQTHRITRPRYLHSPHHQTEVLTITIHMYFNEKWC